MNKNFSIIYNKNHNCFNLTVNAILSRMITDPMTYLWNQAGTIIYNNQDIVTLSPQYEDISNHLLRVANIKTYNQTYNDVTGFHEGCSEIIRNNLSFMVCVDVFELPFNMYYKEKHSVHFIEVVNIKGDTYSICDHFYKYKGEVDKEVIYKAMKSLIKQNLRDYLSIYYFDTNKLDLSNTLDVKNILKTNVIINNGKVPANISFIVDKDGKGKVGTKYMTYFVDYISDIVLKEKKHISPAYRNLYNFGNSRINYALYLENFLEDSPFLDDLIKGYEIIGQEAKIVANHILKLNFMELNKEAQSHVINKLENIMVMEERMTNQILAQKL